MDETDDRLFVNEYDREYLIKNAMAVFGWSREKATEETDKVARLYPRISNDQH